MRHNARQSDDNNCFYFDALFLFTSIVSRGERLTMLQGRQYPTASPAIQPGVSSFDSNAEQRLQMALVNFMHEYFVASKQE